MRLSFRMQQLQLNLCYGWSEQQSLEWKISCHIVWVALNSVSSKENRFCCKTVKNSLISGLAVLGTFRLRHHKEKLCYDSWEVCLWSQWSYRGFLCVTGRPLYDHYDRRETFPWILAKILFMMLSKSSWSSLILLKSLFLLTEGMFIEHDSRYITPCTSTLGPSTVQRQWWCFKLHFFFCSWEKISSVVKINHDSRSGTLAGKVGPLASAIREAVQSDLMDPTAGKLVAVPYAEGLWLVRGNIWCAISSY